jgi:hypothetical protein
MGTVMRFTNTWLGGYPFEVAKTEALFDFCHGCSFTLIRMRTTNTLSCSEPSFRHDLRKS